MTDTERIAELERTVAERTVAVARIEPLLIKMMTATAERLDQAPSNLHEL